MAPSRGLWGVGSEAKNKETSAKCKVGKMLSPRGHTQVDLCTPRPDFDSVVLFWLQLEAKKCMALWFI